MRVANLSELYFFTKAVNTLGSSRVLLSGIQSELP
jgi:hypothetical protein